MYKYPSGASSKDYALIPSGMYYETRRTPTGKVLGIVLHVTAGLQDLDMVGVDDSAEATNRWGASKDRGKASWHVCTDSDTIAPALPDTYTAWHVVGYNSTTWGLEISNQDARWDNKPKAWVEATLRNAARAAAPIVKKYGLPLTLATKAEVDKAIAANKPFGFSYHMWLNPENRRDPGTTFPWSQFITYVRAELAGGSEDNMPEPKDLWSYPVEIKGGEYTGKSPLPARDLLSLAAKFSMYNHNFMRYRLPKLLVELLGAPQDPAVLARAVALELRDDMSELAEAAKAAGSGATASQIVDEFVRRLSNVDDSKEVQG